jgi:hypothetical protein
LNKRLLVVSTLLWLAAVSPSWAASAVWQWSVPVPSLEGRRAYLWVPPDCPKVKGLVVACQNMLEEPLFDHPAFRAACAENGLGIVLIFSGHDRADDDQHPDHPKRSYLDIFLNPNYPHGSEDPQSAGEDLQKALDALAAESGYPEIRYAPLMPVGHSSAGSFVWHLYRWDAGRIFAMMPYKTGSKDDGPQGIPIFDVNSEWFDYGDHSNNCSSNPGTIDGVLRARGNGNDSLFGYYIDIGAGHCNVSDDSMGIVGLWLKTAVAARIPADAPANAPVPLKPVATRSGWLLDAATLGKPAGRPVPYASFPGDPKKAFWYLDEELATAVQQHMITQYAKKPQRLGFVEDDGQTEVKAGTYSFSPRFLDDAGTFRLEARFVDHVTNSDDYPPDTKFGHGDMPILYDVNSGGVTQVGPNTFRVCPRAGPIVPQGNPWEPTIDAYVLGDATYQPTVHPAHVNVHIVNPDGQVQTLDFPKIPDQHAGHLAPIKLTASASSGLPVQFFMVSGPAKIVNGTLSFAPLPVRAKFPIRVLVSSFQWGRQNDPKVQSAGPVTQEFFIQR